MGTATRLQVRLAVPVPVSCSGGWRCDVDLADPLDKAAVDAVASQALASAELTGLFATP